MRKLSVLILYAALASILVGAISFQIMPNSGSISHNDAAYFWNIERNHVRYLGVYSDNYLGEDSSNAVFLTLPSFCLISFFKLLGIGHDTISYLLSFGVVFISVLFSSFVFFLISGSIWLGILSLVFLILNASTIEYMAFGSMGIHFLGLLSLSLLIYIFWRIYCSKRFSIVSSLLISLASFLNFHPFYLLSFLFLSNSFFLFLLIKGGVPRKQVIVGGIISNVVSGALSAYWMIPFFSGFLFASSGTSYVEISDAVMAGFANVASYVNSLSFFQYPNFLGKNFYEIGARYAFYLFAPILLVIPFFIRRRKHSSLLLFLIAIHIFFLNLALGPVSAFWGGLWEYAWNNIPSFSIFRSFTRFQVVLIPLYLFYFSLLHLTLRVKYKQYVYLAASILLIAVNASFLSGDAGGLIPATHIPQEYQSVNEAIENDSDGVIAIFPNVSYTNYNWVPYRRNDLIKQSYFLEDYLFDLPIVRSRASLRLYNKNDAFKKIFSGPFTSNIDEEIRSFNVRYVMVQKDLVESDGTSVAFSDYDAYFISKPDVYAPLLENDFFTLYKVRDITPVLTAENMTFEKVSPWKYRIHMREVSDIRMLEFARNYSEHWKLYPSDYVAGCLLGEDCRSSVPYALGKTCFFEGDELSPGVSVFDNSHIEQDSYEKNIWAIDPAVVKETFPPGSFSENPDGSLDFQLVLFYEKQRFYYYGMIVSILSFLFVFLSILLGVFSDRRERCSPSL